MEPEPLLQALRLQGLQLLVQRQPRQLQRRQRQQQRQQLVRQQLVLVRRRPPLPAWLLRCVPRRF